MKKTITNTDMNTKTQIRLETPPYPSSWAPSASMSMSTSTSPSTSQPCFSIPSTISKLIVKMYQTQKVMMQTTTYKNTKFVPLLCSPVLRPPPPLINPPEISLLSTIKVNERNLAWHYYQKYKISAFLFAFAEISFAGNCFYRGYFWGTNLPLCTANPIASPTPVHTPPVHAPYPPSPLLPL